MPAAGNIRTRDYLKQRVVEFFGCEPIGGNTFTEV
jgi:hypothetical protein